MKLQETPDREVPEHLTSCAHKSICSIYLEFCNEKVPFKVKYLPYLQLANDNEIIKMGKSPLPRMDDGNACH